VPISQSNDTNYSKLSKPKPALISQSKESNIKNDETLVKRSQSLTELKSTPKKPKIEVIHLD
jgi:hypothetical protein